MTFCWFGPSEWQTHSSRAPGLLVVQSQWDMAVVGKPFIYMLVIVV